MNNNAITSVIIWSIVAAALVILLVLGAVLKPVFYIAKGEPREIYSDEKDGNLVDNIKISWFSGNVHVDRSADDIIRVKETSRYNVEPMDISMTDGELMISQKKLRILLFRIRRTFVRSQAFLPKSSITSLS